MNLWWAPVLAFCSMFGQDVLGVLLVQAEAAYRPQRAAVLDVAGDACRIAGLLVNADTLLVRHDIPLSAVTIAATLTADYFGTLTGSRLGRHIDGRHTA